MFELTALLEVAYIAHVRVYASRLSGRSSRLFERDVTYVPALSHLVARIAACDKFGDVVAWGEAGGGFATIEVKARTDWSFQKDVLAMMERASRVQVATGAQHLGHVLLSNGYGVIGRSNSCVCVDCVVAFGSNRA